MLVKKLQSKDCTFAQKAGFSMHFHCRLTVHICSVLCPTARCGVKWGLRPQDTRAARRNNQSLRNAPMLHIHRGVLSESTYRDEDPERAMQPEAVSVMRRRTVPWTYCRSTNTWDLTKSKSYVTDESFPNGCDSTAHPEMAL